MTKEQAEKKLQEHTYLVNKPLKHRGTFSTAKIVSLNIASYENDFSVNCSVISDFDLRRYDDSLDFILKNYELSD